MAIKYVLTQRGNPGNPEAPKKFYAQAKSTAKSEPVSVIFKPPTTLT